LQLATAAGGPPAQIAYSLARSATGQIRIDYGAATSVINDPAAGKIIIIDHIKQEVRTIPIPAVTPPQLQPPPIPGMPALPTPPTTPAMAVKDLGIKIVQGIEVQGKQFTLPPLTPPKPPALPQVPGMPGAPIPGMPGAPAIPKPPTPMIAETWVSTKLQMPVLTRITGSFGQQMCHCKNTVAGGPPATAFQIPPGYKQVGLPAAPGAPAMPAAPAMPGAPALPGAPAMPAAPTMPGAPAMPAGPAMPAAPAMPTVPKPKLPF
jgi:hypothetical protein